MIRLKYRSKIQPLRAPTFQCPVLNQFVDDLKLELPMSEIFSTLDGLNPVVPNKIFYLEEGLRISRDEDDNFFVFTRA